MNHTLMRGKILHELLNKLSYSSYCQLNEKKDYNSYILFTKLVGDH